MDINHENLNRDKGIEILIAEDSPTQAEQLKHILEEAGYLVSVAGNGKEALSSISKHKPTLVVSDVMMPEMDGYQLCEHIKKDEKLRNIPVILVTSLSDPSDIIKGLNCGADHFITKPYDEKYLLARIRYIIANLAIRKGYDAGMGIEIQIGGQKHFITSDRLQIVHLIISTYEAAVHKNQELIRAQEELRALNEQLDEKVRERTAALVEEIKERKEAEESLQKSKSLLNEAERIAHLGSWEWDVENNKLLWSDEIYRIFGLSPGDIAPDYETFLDFIHREDQEPVQAYFSDVLFETNPSHIEHRIKLPDGSFCFVRQQAVIVCDDLGKPIRMLGIMQDITERKQAEKEIREAKQFLELVVGSSPMPIIAHDAQGNITQWNPAAEKLLCWSEREVLGKPPPMIPPENQNQFRETLSSAFKGNKVFLESAPVLRKDGSRILCEIAIALLRGPQSETKGMVAILNDITERKRTEEDLKKYREHLEELVEIRTSELQKANEQLHQINRELALRRQEAEDAKLQAISASRAKSDFLANMSHELRTPLNAVIGFSEILQDEMFGKLNEKQQEYVNDIATSGGHLLNLINDILDLAKVESGKMELELSKFLLVDILEMSKSMFKEKAMKHNIKLGITIEPDADIEIEADERKLKQILFNLLSNAMKFTPDGGSVSVEAKKFRSSEAQKLRSSEAQAILTSYADFVKISVTDTGIGIKQEDMDKLFKEFSQIETPYEKKYQGTGLGLALTKKFVELHGGKIWVESEYGKGAKFTLIIPGKQPS